MDKLSAEGYDTDKDQKRLEIYQEYFPPRDAPIVLLELGIDKGGSLEMWRDWFTSGVIVGLDVDLSKVKKRVPGIIYYEGDQCDQGRLREITRACAPDGWDIVIDDASHRGDLSTISLKCLYKWLKVGGLYIIEDWGTGYMVDPAYDGKLYVEGQNHLAGMAGLVKALIDWCAIPRVFGLPSPVERLIVAPGLAIVRKA